MPSPDILLFEEFALDRAAREIVRGGEPVALQPKAWELLLYLLDRRDRVVSKDELLDALWPDEVVVPEVLTTAMRTLRSALGETAQDQRLVRTVRGHGYRFVAPVRPRSPMASLVGNPAARARHASFVGREREIERFESMLSDAGGPRILYVHGPGGIGKTSILQELAFRCGARRIGLAQLHGEDLAARPRAFEGAVAAALGSPSLSELEGTLRGSPRTVLFVDGFDQLAALGSWFLDVFLPQLPASVSVVLASRAAPRKRWRSDPAWRVMVGEVALEPFDERESRQFLAARRVRTADTEPILRFTKGHPLALAVAVAAVEGGADPRALSHNREVIGSLVEAFADHAPSARHREALEIASLLSSFDEWLLGRLLEGGEASDLYGWLAELPFVRHVPTGLQVHALVRDALLAHLRWRNPSRLGSLAARCYELHFPLLDVATDPADRMALTNRIMSLGRHHPTLRPFYLYDELPNVAIELSSDRSAHEAVDALIRRHEGDDSAAVLARWLDSGFADLWVARDDDELPAGFVLVLLLPVDRLGDWVWDPAVAAIARHLEARGEVQLGGHVVVYRYIVARDGYQAASPVMQRCHEIMNYDLHNMPVEAGIGHSFNVYGEPEIWAPVNAFADFGPFDGSEFVLDGRRFAIFGHSWRQVPLEAWARGIARKLAAGAAS